MGKSMGNFCKVWATYGQHTPPLFFYLAARFKVVGYTVKTTVLPLKKPTLKFTKLYLDRSHLATLTQLAAAKQLSVSALVRLIISEYVREESLCL